MNIPLGYRRLACGEITRGGDELLREDGRHEKLWAENLGKTVRDYEYWAKTYPQIITIRKIEEKSTWIAVSERQPAKQDFNEHGYVLYRDACGRVAEGSQGSYNADNATHWMPIPDPPKPVVEPIIVRVDQGLRGRREVVFEKDGSIKVDCTIVDSFTMDKIIARREEVMKS